MTSINAQPSLAGSRELVQRMGEATNNFLASLTQTQRQKTVVDFDEQDRRTRWFYTPCDRDGLPMTEMERKQQRLAQKLIATGLSRAGYNTASIIMGLEMVLDAREGWSWTDWARDPARYHVTIFGQPDAKKPWGWRFEGHHISLNYTIINGQIIAPTPTFFGSNPAEAPFNGIATLRPLASIEDLARDLVHSLDEHQQHHAILSAVAPPDIMQINRPQVVDGAVSIEDPTGVSTYFDDQVLAGITEWCDILGFTHEHMEAVRYSSTPKGLAAEEMQPAQREMLQALLGEYINRLPEELAEIEYAKLKAKGIDSIHFAWAGGIERYEPHYYRLHGLHILTEYDNTQNDANHIHSVWRDPSNDFGMDLLAHHYAHEH